MAEPEPAGDPARGSRVAVGARAAYDAVAGAYDRQFGDELDGRPLDRALLTGLVELVGAGTIADVGCGPGHVTRLLAKQHPDVVDFDSGHWPMLSKLIELAQIFTIVAAED